MKPTPICLFVYNRPQETEAVLHSLESCRGAQQHPLFIFSDGAKNEQAQNDVMTVRNIIRRPMKFLSVKCYESSKNQGLAASIIKGVTQILQEYEQVIVLEDDLLVSVDFIEYMNAALACYEKDMRIWSISGYSPAIDIPDDYTADLYLTQRASSWGWATWADRWEGIDWNIADYQRFRHSKSLRQQFDQGGNDMSRLLDLQQRGRIHSWAIRWCYAQFLRHMYTVYPVKSKVINQGFGEKATHAGWNDQRHTVQLDHTSLDMCSDLQLDERIAKAFKHHQDLGLVSKIGYFVRLHGLGYQTLQHFLKLILKH